MNVRKHHLLMNEATDGGGADPGAGGAAAPAAAPVAAPAAAPAPPPNASLLNPPGGEQVDPGAFTAEKVPEKFRVTKADGSLDLEASFIKQSTSYTELSKKLGTGEAPPAAATDYAFQPPEALKDFKLDPALEAQFRERAHKAGYTQAQYQAAMEASLELVPQVLDSALKMSADQARVELSKVWLSQADYEAGLANAQRAVDAAPAAVRQDIWARYGRDPAFIQFAAAMGAEMREDKSVVNNDGGTGGRGQSVEALMAQPAYRDSKHPEHAAVSAQVAEHFKRVNGSAPAM